jgi:N-acetyl-1-D-myo-inositol-2-amino-2-deoxy-alpha-D-glucopyranoside deacetylase
LVERNTVLAVFAHPDDESIIAGGTLAYYAARGWRTALICATRGEWGPISDDSLANYETLGEVRERELKAACEVLGITWSCFLDMEDGGVAAVPGSEEEERALEKIVRTIRELRPQIVITFGPDGLYGHPDHVAIGRLTTTACALARDPKAFSEHLTENLPAHQGPELLYATVPQGQYENLIARLADAGHATHLWGIPPEQFGIPAGEITTIIDITPFLDQKLAALRCHRTQIDDSHAFFHLTRDLAMQYLGHEFFRLAAHEPLLATRD